MTNPQDAAFPLALAEALGLSKRECFAALAMQGFAASTALNDGTESAKCAIQWADALITELNK